MGMKFGLATPSMLWDLDWQGRQSMADSIFEAGFDHLFLADHVSFHDGAGADGFVEAALQFGERAASVARQPVAAHLDRVLAGAPSQYLLLL